MPCSSEQNGLCFLVNLFDHVLSIRIDDGLSDHNSLRIILFLLLFLQDFISPIVSFLQCILFEAISPIELVLFLLLLCKFLVKVPNC